MKILVLFLGLTLSTAAARAQEYFGERDFLTQHEIDLIREAQEPDKRIESYLHFAELRLELVRQLMAKESDDRGAQIHRNLDELGRILEAVDMVIDDALVRDIDIQESISPLVERQKVLLAYLEEVQETEPDDLWRYEFVLEDAIDIARDSIEISEADLGDRKRDILEDDEAERAAREKLMTDTRRQEVDKAKGKEERKQGEFERKRPSLLKEGETLGDVNSSDKTAPEKKKR